MASDVKYGDKIAQDRVCAGTIIRDRFGDRATLDNSDDGLWDFGKGGLCFAWSAICYEDGTCTYESGPLKDA